MSVIDRDLRWSHKFPELGQDPLPVEPYISPEYYQKEVEKVFKRVWLAVGRAEQLPEAGCYKLKRLDFAGTSVLILRGKDGAVRAFHNTCSHRGNNVAQFDANDIHRQESFGRRNVLTCRFHGWGYDDRGQLVAVPEENTFPPCFKRSENGLTSIHCDLWEGFIFLNLDEKPQKTLKEFLGDLGELYAGFPFHKLTYDIAYSAILNCNWKIGVDAFSEGYHVRTLHSRSGYGAQGQMDTFQLFGEHRTAAVLMPDLTGVPPVQTLANAKARTSVVDIVEGSSMLPPQMNPDRHKNFGFELSVVFPNFLIHGTDGIWFSHQFWPISYDKCLWEARYCLEPLKNHSQRWAYEHAACMARNLWMEDLSTMEGTYFSLKSKAKKVLNLSDTEIMIRHGYRVLEKYIGEN